MSGKMGFIVLLAPLLVLPLMAACGDDKNNEDTPMPLAEPATIPATKSMVEPVVITIGNHTDLTGPSAKVVSRVMCEIVHAQILKEWKVMAYFPYRV